MRAFLLGLFDLLKLIVVVVVVAFVLRYFVMQPFVVEGKSMEPNFHDNELLIVEKISYQFRDPGRGDIIVFKPPVSPSLNYIKRIVGIPGDRVAIHDGAVYINGNRLKEDYINGESTFVPSLSITDETSLKLNEYFVLGDNRTHSSDSREWGVVPRINIVGRAFLIILPFSDFGMVKHAILDFNPLSSLPFKFSF